MASIKLKHSGGNGVIIAAPTSNPASDKTLTLPSDVDGTVVSKDSSNSLQNIAGINGGQLSNRNLIINGAMQVAQRGTSSTTNGYGSVDRFRVVYTGTDEAPTQSQADVSSGTTPYTLGFRKSLKVTNGNQTGGAGSSDDLQINCRLEGQDIAGSGWNYTSTSSFITLSFWIKSSVAQNFYGYIRSNSGTQRSHPFETGSLSADTWTKVTKTFSGDSSITINNDNTTGFHFFLNAFLGTDLTDNGVSLTAWNTYSSSSITPDNTSTWYTTNDATLEITGVQLEVGSTATDFEHRSFGQELALCQRYFFAEDAGASGSIGGVVSPANANSSGYGFQSPQDTISFPVQMRVEPTCTFTSSSHSPSESFISKSSVTFTGRYLTSGQYAYVTRIEAAAEL